MLVFFVQHSPVRVHHGSSSGTPTGNALRVDLGRSRAWNFRLTETPIGRSAGHSVVRVTPRYAAWHPGSILATPRENFCADQRGSRWLFQEGARQTHQFYRLRFSPGHFKLDHSNFPANRLSSWYLVEKALKCSVVDGGGMIRLRFSSMRTPDVPAVVATKNSRDHYFGALGAGQEGTT